MQTPTRRATRREAPAAVEALPYPELGSTDQPHFWLAVYFRNLSEMVALQGLAMEMCKRRRPERVTMALHGAVNAKRQDIKLSLGYVVENGALPFAHPATTFFHKQVAA